MNKINELLTKAAKEPNFNDAVVYLEKWHKAQRETKGQRETKAKKGKKAKKAVKAPVVAKTPVVAKVLNLKPFNTKPMDEELSAIVSVFLEESNIKDIKKLIFNSVTNHLSTVVFFHTSEHQRHMTDFNSLYSLLSELADIKSHFIEDEKGEYQRVLEDNY